MNSSITNNVKRRRVTINSIVPNDMEKMFTTLVNSDVLIKSKFLTRYLVQSIVIKYVETAKIEEPFTNSCEITCWWKKFIKFVESTNNLLKMNPTWRNLSYDDDDVSTVLDSDEETVIKSSNEKLPPQIKQTVLPTLTQTLPTLKRSLSKMENYLGEYSDEEDSYVYKSMDTGFAKSFDEACLRIRMLQQNKKPPPKVQVRLPPKLQTVTHQQQTITHQQQTITQQQQTITLNTFVDFCRYDFNCLNEQCNRKHSVGVKPSRFNKMCRDGIYCKYTRCSYRH
jgi:hypothetical protein